VKRRRCRVGIATAGISSLSIDVRGDAFRLQALDCLEGVVHDEYGIPQDEFGARFKVDATLVNKGHSPQKTTRKISSIRRRFDNNSALQKFLHSTVLTPNNP